MSAFIVRGLKRHLFGTGTVFASQFHNRVLCARDPSNVNQWGRATTEWNSDYRFEQWMAWYESLPKKRYIATHPRYSSRGREDGNSDRSLGTMSQMLITLLAFTLLMIFITYCRRRYRSHQSALLVRTDVDAAAEGSGDFDNQEPGWLRGEPIITKERSNIGWDRNNVGQYIAVTNSRSLQVACLYEDQLGADGAIFEQGLTSGKHIFAIMWPRDQRVFRGARVVVGFGFAMEMHTEYSSVLVGGNDISFGLDMVSNTLWFDKLKMGKYPREKPRDYSMPTLVYMYIDLDEDRLSFGTDEEYLGIAFEFKGIRNQQPRSNPFFAMAAFRKTNGKFMLFYKGEVPETDFPQPVASTSFSDADPAPEGAVVSYELSDPPFCYSQTIDGVPEEGETGARSEIFNARITDTPL